MFIIKESEFNEYFGQREASYEDSKLQQEEIKEELKDKDLPKEEKDALKEKFEVSEEETDEFIKENKTASTPQIKSFNEVQIDDIGIDYDQEMVQILSKGTFDELSNSKWNSTGWSKTDINWEDDYNDTEWVAVEFLNPQIRGTSIYPYGFDGVYVKKGKQPKEDDFGLGIELANPAYRDASKTAAEKPGFEYYPEPLGKSPAYYNKEMMQKLDVTEMPEEVTNIAKTLKEKVKALNTIEAEATELVENFKQAKKYPEIIAEKEGLIDQLGLSLKQVSNNVTLFGTMYYALITKNKIEKKYPKEKDVFLKEKGFDVAKYTALTEELNKLMAEYELLAEKTPIVDINAPSKIQMWEKKSSLTSESDISQMFNIIERMVEVLNELNNLLENDLIDLESVPEELAVAADVDNKNVKEALTRSQTKYNDLPKDLQSVISTNVKELTTLQMSEENRPKLKEKIKLIYEISKKYNVDIESIYPELKEIRKFVYNLS